VPRSLCLYAQSWDDIKLHWTPTGYVGRLRYWLAETSKGTLHQEDQPLEPFFFSDGPIILPPDLFTDAIEGVPTRLSVTFPGGKDGRVLLAKKPVTEEGVDYLATVFCAKPQQHGIISHAPRNLEDLHHLVASAGLDLLGTLRSRIKDWREPTLLATRLILIIAFPKTRGAQDTIEATDLWAFFTASTIQKVGEQIGVWVMKDGQACPLIGGADQTKNGTGVGLDVLKPQFALDRVAAARLNNIGALEDRAMVAIGAGSLGSHVLTNLARAAFGHWSLIDEDYLLPHNLARHALTGFSVGYDKVISLAVFLNSLFPAHECFVKDVLTANVLRPGTQSPRVQQLLSDAAVILDLSASIPVARHLARDIASTARRVALFFNPQGTDLVLLCEDQARQYPIDALEMQYYRAIIAQPSLQRHLHQPQEGRLRYAQSCRDLTSRIPQDHVALLSAIGSNAFRQTIQQENAAIRLWHLDTTHLAVTPIHISPARIVRVQLGEWTLITDATLLAKIRRLRGRKLPNETGGVLLGSFDITRRIVYVIDTIPSPPDSKEWPTLYIRGHERLPAMIAHVEQATAGNIGYIGEWHSHPNGQRALPSKDDILVFAWLTELMDRDGRPALMLIIGDREYNFFLGNMTEGS
jgi:proteasome lid subunit RPN8/RPN11